VLRKRCGWRRKLVASGWLHDFVRSKLTHKRWSPEQIACRLKSMHPDDPTRLISHETIHAAICAQPMGRAEGWDDRRLETTQTCAGPTAHDAGGRLYRTRIIEDHPSARRDRRPSGARPLWNEAGPWPLMRPRKPAE